MNLSDGFIRRPIATSLLMAAIALFGAVAYRSLPVSDLPNVDFPTLLVTAQLPGASPETMGASVATPLENQFSTIAGLESMTSVNSLGSTQITLEFNLDRSLDGAAVDVQGAITQASRLLPQGMPTPPTFTKVNPADQPILYLVIRSTTLPAWTLDEWAETRIAQRISQVSGVAQVQVLGAQKYAVHAQLDPHQLAARQIGINEVENALRAWNVNVPAGNIIGPHRAYTLQATGQLMNADEFKSMVVAYRNGVPVRLDALGQVVDGPEDPHTASWYYTRDGEQRAITLGIQRQPGTNTIAVANAVRALLPQLLPYQANAVRLDPSDLPIGAELDSVEMSAVPAARSVVKLRFPVRSGRAALIRVRLEGGEAAPPGAEVGIVGDPQVFYMARRGEVFVTGLAPVATLVLRWRGQSCALAVRLPPDDGNDITRLGPLTCAGVSP